MEDNLQTNYYQLLGLVYERLVIDGADALIGDDGLYDVISRRYLIEKGQVKILAHISNTYPRHITEKRLTFIIGMDNDMSVNQLDDLVNRKFLERITETSGDNGYAMTPECYSAFKYGADYGITLFDDCFSELKTADAEDFKSEIWRRRFYESCSLQDNQELGEACEMLGVKGLDDVTQSAFWILVSSFINRFTAPFAFNGDYISTDGHYGDPLPIKQGMGNLVKAGLAISMPIEPLEDSHETERYVLAPDVVRAMFHGHDELARYDEMSKVTNVILAKDIIEKELFFSEASQVEVDHLRKILSADGFQRAESALKRQNRNPAILSLFWGPPGTGKTEVIKQMARESGRDLLIFDAAKVTASAWGAAEKNYRALFLGYNYLVALCTKAPILLLNECDQLLAKRITTMERSIDRCENTVSNIILQGFEDMSGILLATTNLPTNLDSAFDRRFLFKIELTKPDAKARKCIWKSFIPELSDSDAKSLADRFEMTGAQISNVVAKRDLAELYYEGDRGFDYIVGLCNTELVEPTSGPQSRRIGF